MSVCAWQIEFEVFNFSTDPADMWSVPSNLQPGMRTREELKAFFRATP